MELGGGKKCARVTAVTYSPLIMLWRKSSFSVQNSSVFNAHRLRSHIIMRAEMGMARVSDEKHPAHSESGQGDWSGPGKEGPVRRSGENGVMGRRGLRGRTLHTENGMPPDSLAKETVWSCKRGITTIRPIISFNVPFGKKSPRLSEDLSKMDMCKIIVLLRIQYMNLSIILCRILRQRHERSYHGVSCRSGFSRE
jgi:hypothetical protein